VPAYLSVFSQAADETEQKRLIVNEEKVGILAGVNETRSGDSSNRDIGDVAATNGSHL
jgi:hypothetical protein